MHLPESQKSHKLQDACRYKVRGYRTRGGGGANLHFTPFGSVVHKLVHFLQKMPPLGQPPLCFINLSRNAVKYLPRQPQSSLTFLFVLNSIIDQINKLVIYENWTLEEKEVLRESNISF